MNETGDSVTKKSNQENVVGNETNVLLVEFWVGWQNTLHGFDIKELPRHPGRFAFEAPAWGFSVKMDMTNVPEVLWMVWDWLYELEIWSQYCEDRVDFGEDLISLFHPWSV